MFRKRLSPEEQFERWIKWQAWEPYLFWTTGLLFALVVGALLAREHWDSLRQTQARERPGIATVNGEKLSVRDYRESLQSSAGQATLDHLILRKLVVQKARAEGVMVDLNDVELPEKLASSASKRQLRREFRPRNA